MSGVYTIKNLTELEGFAKHVVSVLRVQSSLGQANLLALSGDLGSGKTTFVQALARALGVVEIVQSPTFAILKMYNTTDSRFKQLFHMDAYRIDELNELGPLRFAELLATPNTLFCIEWAEKIKDALPPGIVTIHLTIEEGETRIATMQSQGLSVLPEAVEPV